MRARQFILNSENVTCGPFFELELGFSIYLSELSIDNHEFSELFSELSVSYKSERDVLLFNLKISICLCV